MYVKLDDVLSVLKTRRLNTRSIEVSDNIQQCINQINKLPVEAFCMPPAPEICGKWISASTKPEVNAGMKCSICGARIKNSEHFNGNHRFCHKCGARMINGGN